MGKTLSQTELTAAIVVPILAFILIIIAFIMGKPNANILENFISKLESITLFKYLLPFIPVILTILFIIFVSLPKKIVDLKIGIPIIVIFGLLSIFQVYRNFQGITFNNIINFISNYMNIIKYITMFISAVITFTFVGLLSTNKMSIDIALPIILTFGILLVLSTPPFFEIVKYIFTGTFENIKDFDIKDIFQNDLKNTIPMFIFVVLISVVIYYANTDTSALTTGAYKYALLIFVPFLILMAYNLSTKSPEYAFIGLFALCTIALIGVYLWISMNKAYMNVISFFSKYLLIPFIVLIGFAIFYKMIMQYINNLSGINGFIAELIFFIPCLLIDLLEYIKYQFNITPNTVYILFIIEILLILLYIFLPKIVSTVIKTKSTVLLQNPTFLSKEKLIATSKIGLLENKNSLDQITNTMNYRTNYSISFWTIINTHSNANISSVNKSNIFKYGHIDSNNNKNYKPHVSYVIDKTGDNYIFQFSDTADSIYKLSLPTQKWHNFVFNYNNSRVDLFINGKLEKTLEFSNNLPIYSSSDEIIVGNENGLDGAICNVQYFNVPLTNSDIANLYNLNMLKNPPVE
jgi:hypothetical protein